MISRQRIATLLNATTFCHHSNSFQYFSSRPVHLVGNLFQASPSDTLFQKDLNDTSRRKLRTLSPGHFSNRLFSSVMANSKPILYSYFRSSASWRVRIALHYKGISFEYQPVNLLQREQTGDEYVKLNPMGQVPAFVCNGKTVTQSMAILELVEDLYPSAPLIPNDPFLKAKVREICEVISSGIQPLQNLSVIVKLSEDQVKRTEWANFWITKGFQAVEKLLEESSGKYCVGNEITWADCCLVPQVAAALRFKVKVDDFPNILRINNELSQHEAFVKAHAFVQPDCPEELRQK